LRDTAIEARGYVAAMISIKGFPVAKGFADRAKTG
jgi:hypothetical protein